MAYIDMEEFEYVILNEGIEVAKHKCKDYESYINGANQFRYQMKNAIRKQPTADVVEVVRCSECKHSRPLNKMKSPEKYYKDNCIACECEDVVGDECMIYLGTHFCSYGERSDT